MYELTDLQTESAAGGGVFNDMLAVYHAVTAFVGGFYTGIGYAGGTLNNYYGPDMTLEIFAAGNMGA